MNLGGDPKCDAYRPNSSIRSGTDHYERIIKQQHRIDWLDIQITMRLHGWHNACIWNPTSRTANFNNKLPENQKQCNSHSHKNMVSEKTRRSYSFLSFKNVKILHQQHNYSAYQHSKLSSTILFVIWIKCSPMWSHRLRSLCFHSLTKKMTAHKKQTQNDKLTVIRALQKSRLKDDRKWKYAENYNNWHRKLFLLKLQSAVL